jgi:hypothetical protein
VRFLIAVLVAAMGMLAWTAWRVETTVNEVHEYIKELDQMQTYVTNWRDAKGVPHSVTTPRQQGETAAAHAARHQESVEALQALYPPA